MWHHISHVVLYATIGALVFFHFAGDEFLKGILYVLLAVIAMAECISAIRRQRAGIKPGAQPRTRRRSRLAKPAAHLDDG